MADLGSMTFIGSISPSIARADGYQPNYGKTGYSYSFRSSIIFGVDKDKGPLDPYSVRYPQNALPTPPAVALTTYYVMRGRDVDCGVTTYRTWTTANAPDPTGALYGGAKCGASALADVIVVQTYRS